jgi:hypothetical protein
MTDRFAIVPVPDNTDPPATAILVGPLDECLACISVATLNENLVAENERLSALAQSLDEREQALNARDEQSTQLVHKTVDAGTRIVDSFEKARALSMKRAEAEQQRRSRQRVAAMVDTWPDPDAPALASDEGELEVKHKPVIPGHDPGEEDDTEGDLPTELQEATPPTPGSSPLTSAKELGTPKDPKQTPQPISVSLW